jgi:hypothetical protein
MAQRANRYIVGAAALAAKPAVAAEIIGYDWWQVLYNPGGLAMDMYNQNNPGQGYRYWGNATANPYWAQRRAQQSPFAAANVSRAQAAEQLQQTLRAQQAANLAALQRQLAALGPTGASSLPATPAPPATNSPDDFPTPPAAEETVVGADIADQFVVIRIKNMADVIKAQGGALGNLAFSLTPQTVANLAFSRMRDEFKKSLADKGVDADVTLAAAGPATKAPRGELVTGVIVGAGAIGVGWGLWRLLRSLKTKR